MALDTAAHILIVGAGCFGLSTAYHLLERGFNRLTVVDRAEVLPAQDAASTDLNKGEWPCSFMLFRWFLTASKVVRSSYMDPFYARFAQDAIQAWKNEKWAAGVYHE
jgi:sarcosine oxidase / L-pipecolate oxidase